MNISAINCTPIKPQSFGMNCDGEGTQEVNLKKAPVSYDTLLKTADEFESNYIASSDVKTPGQIATSVGLLGIKTFAVGAAAATLMASLSGGKIPNTAINGLKNVSKGLINTSQKLAEANTGKLGKVRSVAAKGIAGAEKYAHAFYNKVIAKGTEGDIAKQFSRLVGLAVAANAVPAACKIDNNNDGISDITQRSQSIYDTTKTNCNKLVEGASLFSEVASVLT